MEKENKSDSWIAKELNVSINNLKRWKKQRELKIVTTSKGRNILDSILSIETYIKWKIQHKSDELIAHELNVSFRTLERWKQKHEITKKHS